MSSNSSSIVISFSIAILLLLTLLLLISYNSKCKMDNIERFENDAGNFLPSPETLKRILTPNVPMDNFSVANNDKYAGTNMASDPKLGSISASDTANSYTSVSGEPISSSNEISHFAGDASVDSSPDSCFVRDRLTSSDLLPKDAANSKWAQINPAGSGMLGDQNFLTAGYHVGINTIGQSLRNANLQLRSEPPNPQVAVSPWGISTIEPDVRAVAFEIGSSPSF
jgi:hypothetical protein